MTTMAEIEAFAPCLQDVASGPRFASVKIDGANLERVLSSRDGTFIVNRIRGARLGRLHAADLRRSGRAKWPFPASCRSSASTKP